MIVIADATHARKRMMVEKELRRQVHRFIQRYTLLRISVKGRRETEASS